MFAILYHGLLFFFFFHISLFHFLLLFRLYREKKREKERDELWKRLSQLELNHKTKHQSENNVNEVVAPKTSQPKD